MQVVVVVIVPVLLIVPAMGIDVPPLVVLVPAPFTGFVQFGAGVVGFGAGRAVMVDRFVKIVIGVLDAMPAFVVFVGASARHGGEAQQCGDDGK